MSTVAKVLGMVAMSATLLAGLRAPAGAQTQQPNPCTRGFWVQAPSPAATTCCEDGTPNNGNPSSCDPSQGNPGHGGICGDGMVSFGHSWRGCQSGNVGGSPDESVLPPHLDYFACVCAPGVREAMAAQGNNLPIWDNCEAGNGSGGACGGPEPELCDGLPADPVEPAEEGCGNSGQCPDDDRDPSPLRYSSGRIETQPITLFSLPTPDGIFFGVRLEYGSHTPRQPAQRVTIAGTTYPASEIHSAEEDTHFFGAGWTDNLSHRIGINLMPGQGGTMVAYGGTFGEAASPNLSLTATINQLYDSFGGRYQLEKLALPPPGQRQRWRLSSRDPHAPRHLRIYEEVPFTSYGGNQRTFARLVREALSATTDDATAYYALDIVWSANNTVSTVTDTLGRQLRYNYADILGAGGVVVRRQLSSVDYRPFAGATPEVVATFGYYPYSTQLAQVTRAGQGGYTRFNYSSNNSFPQLTEVIVAHTALASPTAGSPAGAGEVVTESHLYENVAGRPRGIYTASPSHRFGYEYVSTLTYQYDLDQREAGTSCGSCGTGHRCYDGPGTTAGCFVYRVFGHEQATRNQTLRSSVSNASSSGGGGGGGPPVASSIHTSNPVTGNRTSTTDEIGTVTTYGTDSYGRLRCLVRDDDDLDAFATPASPDTSACDPPATGANQTIRVDYGAGTITKTTPGILTSNPVVEVETLHAATLLTGTRVETGRSRNIDGTAITQVRTSTRNYDSLGRVIQVDGPLDNAVARDVTDITYHATNGTGFYNLGHVATVTRYVGTTAASTPLTTTYSNYDRFGVPGKVQYPNGDFLEYTPTPFTDRLSWTIRHKVGTTTLATWTVHLNSDGSLRAQIDPDGVCLTYSYTDTQTGQFLGVPTAVKRTAATSSACGLPVDPNTDEVELRQFVAVEGTQATPTRVDARRLYKIERRQGGVVQMSYTGFVYDSERRVRQAASLDGGGQNYLFDFTDGLPTGTTAPGGPAAGTWKTTTGADEFGRPTHVWRHLTASSKQTYSFAYDNSFAPRPTTLTRGVDGSSGAVSTFVYDDFGRLVQSVTPEHGTTRYEYDLADNLFKERVGVGTALVRTSVRSYDSLGRLTFVDHDTEHPVNCSSGTAKIQDEEYKYDGCAGDAPAGVVCGYALGRLTIARTHLHCSGGATVKRGRWYNYDAQGRVASVALASQTTTGATSSYGTAVTMSYVTTPGGRTLEAGSPLNTGFGTAYTLSPSTGLPTSLTTKGGSPMLSAISYQAFGGVSGYTTAVLVPTVNRTLKFQALYRSDGALSGLRWLLDGATDAWDLSQDFGYTKAGLLATRTETALTSKLTSRYYGYDALLRLTCEARGDATTQPTAADCGTKKLKMGGLFTYHDGASATAPPDVRSVAHIRRADYNTLDGDVSTYAGGSGQVQTFTRDAAGTNTMVLGHDALGRRSFEYDAFDATRSRRDYTYLPNGQLGTITGQTPTNAAYEASVNYDHEGRPLTMSFQTGSGVAILYEWYWDDSSRLISMRVDDNPGQVTQRKVWTWHYHYLGDQVVAATREKKVGTAAPVVQRYWAEFDERGLIYNMVTIQGVKDLSARYDASGWRQVVTQVGGADMYVPFGLPGQLTLERVATNGATAGVDSTAAYASGAGFAHTRPPLMLNQWRVYDPLLGAYLQPDGLDRSGRMEPEGYVYARSGPTTWVDPTARDSRTKNSKDPELPPENVNGNCGDSSVFVRAATKARSDIQKCTGGACGFPGGDTIRRAFMYSLVTGHYDCPKNFWDPKEKIGFGPGFKGFVSFASLSSLIASNLNPIAGVSLIPHQFPYRDRKTIFSPAIGNPPRGCLAREIAHEAFHAALHSLHQEVASTADVAWLDDYLEKGSLNDWVPDNFSHVEYESNSHGFIDWTVFTCISC